MVGFCHVGNLLGNHDVDGGDDDDDDDDDDTRFISASSIVPLPSTSYLKIKFYKCWRDQTHIWFDLIPEN